MYTKPLTFMEALAECMTLAVPSSQNTHHPIPSGEGSGSPGRPKGRVRLAREARHRGAKRSAKRRRAA